MTAPAAPPIPSTDALLRALADATATVTGQEFFDALTRVLGTTLHANHVALSQLVPGRTDRVETLSAYADGAHQPSFAYDLDVTPCKNVLGKQFAHHPDRVVELFPDDQFFVATNTRSYIGVPLAAPDNKPLGLLTLCHDHPTPHLAHLRDVLTLFAGRAAAEINRLHAEHSLRTALASLDEQVRDRTAALRREIDQRAATEHDLRVSRQRYAAILNSQQTFVARCDPAGRVTYQNDAHARAFALNLGDDIASRVHPDDRPALDSFLAALGAPPHHVAAEQRWRSGGQWRHVLWHASAILDDAGHVAEVQGVGFDVTDRTLAERDLATVTSSVPCLLWQADCEGLPGWEQDVDGRNLLYRWAPRVIDESAAQHILPLDLKPGQSYLQAWYASRHPDDTDAVNASTAQALIMGLANYSREFRCLDRTGQVHWLREDVAVQRLAPNRWQLFGVVTDVTPRKLAELAVRESEHRFRAMGDSAPVLIWLTDVDDRTVWYNKPWRDFVGLPPDADPADGWENALHPDDRDRCIAAYRTHSAARAPFQLEYRLRRHDGQYRWLLDHAVPRRHPDGSFAGFIGSAIDITDRKRAELDLSTVTSRVPCILWRSTVDGLPGWQDDHDGQRALFRWDLTIIDEAAAQHLLPIDVPPGKLYRDIWGSHLHPDDRPHLRRTTARALLANHPNYDREYRVIDRHGHLHWFHEDVYLEPRGPGAWELFGVVTDVTPHKLAELALRESEARYDLAARAGRVGVWEWDLTHGDGPIYLSDNLKALLGYPPDFPLEHGPTWHDHLHPDDMPAVRAATHDYLAGHTPVYELEVRRRHRDGSWRWFLSRGTATRDPATGRPLRFTGSLTDITDRKRAEDALRASESRYALATGAGRVGVWEYDVDADALYLSPNVCTLLGYAPGEITTMAAWRGLIHADDLPRVLAANADPNCVEFESEVRRRHKDGSYRWLLSRGTKTRDPATGRLLRITGAHTDITDRKRAEEALRASEARYALATDAGRVGVWEYDVDAGTVLHSPNSLALLGYAPDEIATYDAWMALVHPDDRAAGHAARDNPAADTFEVEVRRRHKDGSYRWFLSRGSIARDPATGRALRMTGAHTDITDRKHADAALRESETRYTLATDAGRVGVWEYDADADALYLSPHLCTLMGYAPNELPDMRAWRALIHPDDLPSVMAINDDPASLVFEFEARRRLKDGTYGWFLSRGTIARDPATGRAARITGTHTDVTDRRRAQDALRQTQHRYALATEAAHVGVWEYDYDADTFYLSPNLPLMLGYPPDHFKTFPDWFALVHPDDIPTIHASMHDTAALDFDMEVRRRHADGSWRWLSSRGTMTRDPATGRLTRINGIFTDVTDRRRAQDALRTSEARFALATDAGRVGILDHDYTSGTVYVSPKLAALHGYEPAELTTFDAWAALVHPDEVPHLLAIRNDPAVTTFQLETRRRHKDGSYRWFLSRGTITRDPATGLALHLTGTLTDITDLKRAENALRASEARYALATGAGRVGVWEYDAAADALYLSPVLHDMLGYAPGEIRSLDQWVALAHPDDVHAIDAVRHDRASTAFEFEVRRRRKDGAYRWFISSGTITRDPATGRITRVTGIHTDITDRKVAELRYALATDAGRVGIWEVNYTTGDIYLSPKIAALHGYTPDDLTTLDAWHALVHPDDRPRVLAVRNDPSVTDFELKTRRRHKDGAWLWFLSRGTVTRAPDGTPLRLTGTLTDITDLKRAEDALRDSERRYTLATEAGHVGVWEYDIEHDSFRHSPNSLALLGYRPDELTTLDAWMALVHPDDHAKIRATHQPETSDTFELEIRRRHKDGSYRWFLSRGTVTRNPRTGAIARITGAHTDITDLRRTQDALAESERRYALAADAGRVGIVDFDIPADRLFLSPALKSLLGYTDDELPDDHLAWRRLLHPDDLPRVSALYDDFLAGRTPVYELEVRRRHKDGSYRWLLSRGSIARDPATGAPVRYTGSLTDITDRKRAEDALLESQRRYTLATEAGGVGIWDYEDATDTFYLSPNLRSMLGYAPDEVTNIDAWRDLLHPDDRATVTASGDCRDTTFAMEVRRRCKDGSYRWFLSRGTVAFNPATRRRTRITGVLADITDRKRADDALRASEEHFRTLLEQSPIATFIFSPDGDFLRCNPAASDMYGLAEAELRGLNIFSDPIVQGTPIPDAYAAARDGRPTPLPEAHFTPRRGRASGKTLWIRGAVYPLRDPTTGRVHALVGLNEDITERKRVEQALLSSERRFRKLVEQSPLSTQFFAPDGTVRAANRAWERLFGVTVTQIAGYNLLHDPQLVDAGIMPLLRRAFDGDATTIPVIPYVPPFGDFAGQTRWCSALIFPVKDAAGRVEEVVLIHHDMTEQKRAEDALRASEAQYRTAADANRRLLLELDHRVRNNLAGLVSLVSLMRDRAPDVDAFASSIDARLRAMSHVHHLLSESRGQDLDLRALLASFLSQSRDLAPYPTPVRLDGPPVPLPSPLALPLTLILSEFLTNSAKYGAHSTPAGSVSLFWTLTPPAPLATGQSAGRHSDQSAAPDSSIPQSATRNPQSLSLHWTEHNGPPPHPHPTPSLGSALIESFSTRELAGSCSLTYPPSGAAHTLTFPLPD